MFLSNTSRVLKEYTGDLDYYMFYSWVKQLANQPGVFNFEANTEFVKRNFILNKQTLVLFGVQNDAETQKESFKKGIKRVAERLSIDILWGKATAEYKDEVDYVDC
jgi:hypothetical protein